MKITNVETHLVRLPFDTGGGEGFAFTDWPSLDYVLVRVDTEDGITGWGDAFGYGAAFATRAAVDHMIAPALIGMDSRDINGVMHRLHYSNHIWGRYGITMFALSGVDIALWDIAGKRAGVPVHQLLGGARRMRIPAYASLFHYRDPEKVAQRTQAALDEGYGFIKLHETREQEVRAARETAGADIPLMVDTNCPWTPQQAAEMALRLKPYDLYWLEEPIFPPEDFAALAKLGRDTGVALAAGENACTAFEFKKMMDAGAVRFHQPSVTKVGGISEMRKILTLAEAHGATVVPHCPYFGPGLLASLHVLAIMRDDALAEFFYYKTLGASFYGDMVRTVDGHFVVPDGPGLGADPDMQVVKEFGVDR